MSDELTRARARVAELERQLGQAIIAALRWITVEDDDEEDNWNDLDDPWPKLEDEGGNAADDEQGREDLQETVDILSRSRDRGYRLLREARSILDAWEGMNEFGDIIDNDDVRIISNRVLAWKKALVAYEWGERGGGVADDD